MQSGLKVSIRSIMLFVVLVALQLAAFQGVWLILVIPPITIAFLTLNLGLFFLVARPKAMDTRIEGMLLGGVAGVFTTIWPLTMRAITILDDFHTALVNWISTLPNQQGPTATALRFLSHNRLVIGCALLDILGLAMIWAGGCIESRLRSRRVQVRAPKATARPPLDDRAATPL
jgi:hypothetical protein